MPSKSSKIRICPDFLNIYKRLISEKNLYASLYMIRNSISIGKLTCAASGNIMVTIQSQADFQTKL